MAERRTPIQVPPRGDDEAPASPEQLQLIRELVTGMSLSGFRFDYRKMGAAQAASVTEQLLAMKRASGVPAKQSGGGCIGSLVRGTVRLTVSLIVLAVVVAGVAGGGYLIYQKMNETPQGEDEDPSKVADGGGDAPDKTSSNDGRHESKIFEGLYVDEEPGGDGGDTGSGTPTPRTGTGTPSNENVTPPAIVPRADPAVKAQLGELEKLLVQLSQFTRKDYPASVRAQSAQLMAERLDAWPAAMDAIKGLDPALAERVRQVVAGYAAESIDGTAVRAEIDAIRARFDELFGE